MIVSKSWSSCSWVLSLLIVLTSAVKIQAETHNVSDFHTNREAMGRLSVSPSATALRYGVRFECSVDQINKIEKEMISIHNPICNKEYVEGNKTSTIEKAITSLLRISK